MDTLSLCNEIAGYKRKISKKTMSVFGFLGLDGESTHKSRIFCNNAHEDANWAFSSIVRFLQFQNTRVNQKLITYQELLETHLDHRMEEGNNPRELEKDQILRLMNIIAEEIYIGKFDPSIGTFRIENRIQKDEKIPEEHLRAYRLSREEIIYTWLNCIRQVVSNYFRMFGKPVNDDKLFQDEFPAQLWSNVNNFIRNLKHLPVWINTELSLSVFGGKQNYEYWQTIFETARSPQGQQVLVAPINLMDMIKE